MNLVASIWASVLALIGVCAWLIAAICVVFLAIVLVMIVAYGIAATCKAIWDAWMS